MRPLLLPLYFSESRKTPASNPKIDSGSTLAEINQKVPDRVSKQTVSNRSILPISDLTPVRLGQNDTPSPRAMSGPVEPISMGWQADRALSREPTSVDLLDSHRFFSSSHEFEEALKDPPKRRCSALPVISSLHSSPMVIGEFSTPVRPVSQENNIRSSIESLSLTQPVSDMEQSSTMETTSTLDVVPSDWSFQGALGLYTGVKTPSQTGSEFVGMIGMTEKIESHPPWLSEESFQEPILPGGQHAQMTVPLPPPSVSLTESVLRKPHYLHYQRTEASPIAPSAFSVKRKREGEEPFCLDNQHKTIWTPSPKSMKIDPGGRLPGKKHTHRSLTQKDCV